MLAQCGILALFLTGLLWNLSNDVQHVGFVEVAGPCAESLEQVIRCLPIGIALAYSFILLECLHDA